MGEGVNDAEVEQSELWLLLKEQLEVMVRDVIYHAKIRSFVAIQTIRKLNNSVNEHGYKFAGETPCECASLMSAVTENYKVVFRKDIPVTVADHFNAALDIQQEISNGSL